MQIILQTFDFFSFFVVLELNSYNMMKIGKYTKHTVTLLIEMLLNWKMCVLFLSHRILLYIKIKHYTKLNNLIFILLIVKA